MASVFTYETNPVRVGSPWPRAPMTGPTTVPVPNQFDLILPPAEALSDYGILKLIPEPQEGPVEYKLHLLLRPRRNFSATSTVQKVSGSHLSKSRGASLTLGTSPRSGSSTPLLAPSNVSKQNRLQHLTTQLLWRLQQSSPCHSSIKSDLVLPVLPEAELRPFSLQVPGKLIAGLEDSLGALYEIGVSDDGSFVGLTIDEIHESFNVLCAMSFSLGCYVRVVRMVDVGDCEWSEEAEPSKMQSPRSRREKLWVAEVSVDPHPGLHHQESENPQSTRSDNAIGSHNVFPTPKPKFLSNPRDSQLRVTLTGNTTSGKSSLLGTLSTSTLDNGRGKSRLSLLKHRHEIVSGITSSLAQELIGYYEAEIKDGSTSNSLSVVNYASANVSSWIDIHNTARPGRLAFVTDSAGHPRYRRTTVRGIISWAPHWTLCCVAADNNEENTGKIDATASANDMLGSSGRGVELSKGHLELCMKLELPLVVIITKYDLASKASLRQTLTKVLSILKDAGRKPAILPLDSFDRSTKPSQHTSMVDEDTVAKMIDSTTPNELPLLVPIVLTSAVTGVGILKVHALLRQLPILSSTHQSMPHSFPHRFSLFHIDEVFTKAQRYDSGLVLEFIISGYLRYGTVTVGGRFLVGPFHEEGPLETSATFVGPYASSYPTPRACSSRSNHLQSSNNRASSTSLNELARTQAASLEPANIWRAVTVSSIRNLRLPVHVLNMGEVATIAIRFNKPFSSQTKKADSTSTPALRRGMVLIQPVDDDERDPPAYSGFTAVFKEPNAYVIPGSSVTVYIASIRASAKIIEVRAPDNEATSEEVFDFDNSHENGGASTLTSSVSSLTEKETQMDAIEITFRFSSSTEWIEIGTQVVVTPASGLSMLNPLDQGDLNSAGAAGLDGFVGRIVSASIP